MVGNVCEQEFWGLCTGNWISVHHHIKMAAVFILLFIIGPPESHACMDLALGMCLHFYYFILFIQNMFIYFLYCP